VSQGTLQLASGGGERGFLAAFASSFATKGGWLPQDRLVQGIVGAIVGGTSSEIGGGKFENGAFTGAMVGLYNGGGKQGSLIAIDEDVAYEYVEDGDGKVILKDGKPLRFLDLVRSRAEKLNEKYGSENDQIYVAVFDSKNTLQIVLDVNNDRYTIVDGDIMLHGNTAAFESRFADGSIIDRIDLNAIAKKYNMDVWSCSPRMRLDGIYGIKDVEDAFIERVQRSRQNQQIKEKNEND